MVLNKKKFEKKMRVVLLCFLVVIVGVVSAKKNGNGDGKGTLQMMGED